MKTIIIGAGFAGLSAAHKLKKDYMVLERESRPGGLCKTENVKGFLFDYTGHLMHIRDKNIEKFVLKNTPAGMNKIKRRSYIFSHGKYTEYPYQSNNYGLPGHIIAENLAGFLRAKMAPQGPAANFKDWVYKTFGQGIARNFMIPYNSKLWKYPLDRLTLEWMGRFVPSPSIDDVFSGILPKAKDAGYNIFFYYPEKGGIESVISGLYAKVKDNVRLDAQVRRIDTKRRVVYYNDEEQEYENIISTAPLPALVKMTGDTRLIALASGLKAVSVYSLNIGYRAAENNPMHWVYMPEEACPFYRMGFPHNLSSFNSPQGYYSLFTEVSFRGAPPKGINSKIINYLVKIGVIKRKKDIAVLHPVVLKDAYVIYDKEREKALPEIKAELEKRGIYLAGRWGRWEYSSMEDAITEGFETADKILKLKK
jgi:protoporphyrinogen oxidase